VRTDWQERQAAAAKEEMSTSWMVIHGSDSHKDQQFFLPITGGSEKNVGSGQSDCQRPACWEEGCTGRTGRAEISGSFRQEFLVRRACLRVRHFFHDAYAGGIGEDHVTVNLGPDTGAAQEGKKRAPQQGATASGGRK
jgi:hypothetical protein